PLLISITVTHSVSFYSHTHHRDLPSFPTRRSSDLRLPGLALDVFRQRARCRTDRPGDVDETAGLDRAAERQARVRSIGLLRRGRSEEHTSELQSRENLVCRLLLEKKKNNKENNMSH